VHFVLELIILEEKHEEKTEEKNKEKNEDLRAPRTQHGFTLSRNEFTKKTSVNTILINNYLASNTTL
jgi:hypothetical protein